MKFIDNVKLRWKINTLKNEKETLERALKDGLYTSFIEYIDRQCETEKLKEDNKRLRREIKELKGKLK